MKPNPFDGVDDFFDDFDAHAKRASRWAIALVAFSAVVVLAVLGLAAYVVFSLV